MKRREALLLLSTSAACAVPLSLVSADEVESLTDAEFETLLREFLELEPLPGEAARIRAAYIAAGIISNNEPTVQPALAFDPEVEL